MATENKNEKVYKGTILVLVIIIAVLTFMLITSRMSLKESTVENIAVTEKNLDLQNELDSLLLEYNMVKFEYDSILSDKDSIIQANAKEIQQLIAQQGDYNRIRRQLNLLRDITQNYVREIDSLHTENKVLKAENVKMQEEIHRVTQQTTQLTQSKVVLEEKIEMAATLRAYQINANALRLRGRGREEETDRASRTDIIRVCFNVAENPVAQAGNRNAYVRIADPKGSILRLSDEMTHAFIHGQDTLQFSVKGQFNYTNQQTEMCLDWNKRAEFEPGIYQISIFTDANRMGETQLNLR